MDSTLKKIRLTKVETDNSNLERIVIKVLAEGRTPIDSLEVYRSRPITFDKGQIQALNESFEVQVRYPESCIQVSVAYSHKKAEGSKLCNFIFMYSDLLKKDRVLRMKLDNMNFSLSYELDSQEVVVQPCHSVFDDGRPPADSPGLIELLTLTRQFLTKVSVIRRLQEDVVDFFTSIDLKRDSLIFLGLLIALMNPWLVPLIVIPSFLFTSLPYHFRRWMLRKLKEYADPHESRSVEESRNQAMIKVQQVTIIKLNDNIHQIFLAKNRKQLVNSQLFILVGVCVLPFALLLQLRHVILLGIFGFFAQKYLSYYGLLPESGKPREMKKSSIELIQRKPQKLRKTCFTFENQRWYMGQGYVSKTLGWERPEFSDKSGDVSLKPASFEQEQGWVWENSWTIYKSSNTDEEGWQYATGFAAPFHKEKNALDVVRRRVLTRDCYLLEK